jgi:hypothetical protein
MIRDNTAEWGGAIYCGPNGSPVIENCVIRDNAVEGNGGGISCPTCKAKILNCLIEGNTAKVYGGGVRTCYGGDLTIANCVFRNNSAGDDGGGFECCYSNATVIGCLFEGNVSGAEGGGIWCLQTVTVEHCTIVGNKARLIGGGLSCNRERCVITNSIIRDNLPDNFYIYNPNTEISYCNRAIVNDYPGIGNIDVDPCFAGSGLWAPDPCDPLNESWIGGDYHLKSPAGRWDPVSRSWVIDDVTSPCIDAGDPNSPVAFEPYPNGGIVNMGAYGGTTEASKAPSGLHAKYGGGMGEPNAPFLIYTPEHLNKIGVERNDWDKHFKLMADIDLSTFDGKDGRSPFNIIASDTDPVKAPCQVTLFTGLFDGNGHTISHLTVSGGESLGLFGRLGSGGHIKKLGVVDVNITGSGDEVGGLAGYSEGDVSDCYTTGAVKGRYDVGGVVGWNRNGTLIHCYSRSAVIASSYVGGLAGYNGGIITQCHSTGEVSGTRDFVGGLIGSNSGGVTDCFWDTQTSGQPTSAAGTGRTTTQMQTAGTFLDTGWDLVGEIINGTEDIWWIVEGKDYPRLWWELTAEETME